MSADNGVYIGKFPQSLGIFEYRVRHVQAIDNCDYGDEEMQDAYRFSYFGGENDFFLDEVAAFNRAREIYKELDVCEYGIQILEFDRPIKFFSKEDLNRVLQ